MSYNNPTEEYKPHFNELLVKQFIQEIDKAPENFNADLIAQVQQDASHYGILYHGPDSELHYLVSQNRLVQALFQDFLRLMLEMTPQILQKE